LGIAQSVAKAREDVVLRKDRTVEAQRGLFRVQRRIVRVGVGRRRQRDDLVAGRIGQESARKHREVVDRQRAKHREQRVEAHHVRMLGPIRPAELEAEAG
jgi:hypothetical protein